MPVLIHMITHIYIHVRHITHTHGGRETGREGEGERGEETVFLEAEVELRLSACPPQSVRAS